jgi:predicted GNAT family acetyltransferase
MSRVIRHTDPDAFLLAAQPVLARSEAAAVAYTAWTRGLRANAPGGAGALYLATYAHDGSYGAAMRRPPEGPLVVEESDPAAAAAFAQDLAAEVPGLAGVVGALPACEAFARTWRECTGRVHALRFHLRHHRLTEVAPVPVAAGAPRAARPGDGDWLIEAQREFLVEAGVPDNVERVAALMPGRIARGEYWIWDDQGPVAFAGWSDAGGDAARIAPVYTAWAARRRGYATVLVAALAQALLAAGRCRLFLVTDVANPTSNAIYARIGFRPMTDLYHFDLVDPVP